MPVWYRAVGWSYKSGFIYPDGGSITANFFRPFEGAGATWRFNAPIRSDVAAVIDPKWQNTKNLWMPASLYAKNMEVTGDVAWFFGNMYPEELPPPSPLSFTLSDWRIKPASKFEAFKKAQVDGRIIVQPLKLCSFTGVSYPGLKLDSIVARTPATFRRAQGSTLVEKPGRPFEVRYSPLFKRNGWEFPSYPGEGTDNNAWSGNIHSVVEMLHVNAGVDPYYLASEHVVGELHDELVRAVMDGTMDTTLVTTALADANSQNVDLWTMLAELPETIKYIVGILLQILKLCKNFRTEYKKLWDRLERARKRIKTVTGEDAEMAGLLDKISSLWLQFRYAVMPMVYSVDGAIEQLGTGARKYVSTRKRVTKPLNFDHPDWELETDVEIQHRVFIKRRYEFNSETLTGSSNNLFKSLPATAWELTTLSFVVDWVLNVGDLLTSLSMPDGIEDQGATYSWQIEKASFVFRHKRNPGALVVITGGAYSATPFNPLGQVGLSVGNRLNWRRAMDAVSLIWLMGVRSIAPKHRL